MPSSAQEGAAMRSTTTCQHGHGTTRYESMKLCPITGAAALTGLPAALKHGSLGAVLYTLSFVASSHLETQVAKRAVRTACATCREQESTWLAQTVTMCYGTDGGNRRIIRSAFILRG
eukprot:CAMPEP_0172819574 /NCGR_PEP_ID=MMETSP1075-20121228/14692_1 /TAXON_ID=2916 /ORGANISM="Ceratium fusus, Strain PA161109" /LENGTH=117 /DNA_ID=CAMNT_0013660121 /DNA_START=12 /DNA_END=366 /DNA_ORIENTATION=-